MHQVGVESGGDGWMARNSEWESQTAEGTALWVQEKGCLSSIGTHQGSGQGTMPHTATNVTHPGFGECKLAVPVQKTQDLCV